MKYKDVVDAVEKMECFTRYTGETAGMFHSKDAFFLKGTRFVVAFYFVNPTYLNWKNEDKEEKVKVRWFIKKKNKKYFTEIKFLDVLDMGHVIKPSRRAELLFHLDILT
jgi:hypothetical protein